MKNRLRFLRGHEPDVNALSAQLDGRLDAPEAARLQAHLASCEACRARLDGLRATRAALRAMPEAAAPRSFRLRVADVERAPDAAAKTPSSMLWWAPAVSAVAAVVFAIVVGVDLSSSRGGSSYSADRAPLAAARATDTKSIESSGNADMAPSPASVPPTIVGAEPPSAMTAPYDATGTQTPREAVRPAATATSELTATSGRAVAEDGGNNTTALRVIEIVAAAIAVLTAVAAGTLWRRGRERL